MLGSECESGNTRLLTKIALKPGSKAILNQKLLARERVTVTHQPSRFPLPASNRCTRAASGFSHTVSPLFTATRSRSTICTSW